jgi:hypothetical protein
MLGIFLRDNRVNALSSVQPRAFESRPSLLSVRLFSRSSILNSRFGCTQTRQVAANSKGRGKCDTFQDGLLLVGIGSVPCLVTQCKEFFSGILETPRLLFFNWKAEWRLEVPNVNLQYTSPLALFSFFTQTTNYQFSIKCLRPTAQRIYLATKP